MKNKTLFLLGIVFILCLTLLFGLCSCDEDAPSSESTGVASDATDSTLPNMNDIFDFPEGGFDLPMDEFE